MNSYRLVTLVAMSAILSCSAFYVKTLSSPITLCLKSDYSWCTNVTYPNSCVNMDTVVMNGTAGSGNGSGAGNGNGTAVDHVTAFKNVESVIVTDVDSTEDKCIVLFDKYNCQGHYLVLNGSKHPAAKLGDFGFANRAESYRRCTDRLLSWLRDNNY